MNTTPAGAKGPNPYESPQQAAQEHTPRRRSSGASWGLLAGAMHGATFGAMAGVTLACIATVFYAFHRPPGWFGPSDGMAVRLTLTFFLMAMLGGVSGLCIGAVCGVLVGLIGAVNDRVPQTTVGSLLFMLAGGLVAISCWGRPLAELESPWRLPAYGAIILVAALYSAAAGRRTAMSIEAILESLERKERLERLDPPA